MTLPAVTCTDEGKDRMPKLGRVLVMDAEVDMLQNCARLLTHFGYEVVTDADGGKAATLYERERPDLVLTDLRMPGLDGLGVLQAIRAIDAEATVILITAFATIETAVEAIKEGAFDYLPKPFSADQLKVCVERAIGQRRLREENRRLLEQLTETHRFDNIIGRSLPMLQVFETIKKVARSEANILIIGETGTGKELIARSLHVNSRRAAGPFIKSPQDTPQLAEGRNASFSGLFFHEDAPSLLGGNSLPLATPVSKTVHAVSVLCHKWISLFMIYSYYCFESVPLPS